MKIKNNPKAVFAAAFVSIAATALTNVWSVFLKPMAESCGCSLDTVRLSYSCYALMQAIFGVIAAQVFDRIGFRKVIIFGSACMAAGLAGMGMASGPAMLFFSFSFLFGMGAGCVYSISVTNTLKWFPVNKGRISGLLLAAASIMGIVSAPVVNALIDSVGVRNCCYVLAIAYAAAFAATAWMAQAAPEEAVKAPAAGSAADLTWKEMLKTGRFYVALMMFICANTGYVMMINSSSAIAQAYTGMSASAAAAMVAATSGFNLFGRIFFGWLSDKVGRVRVLAGICLLEFGLLVILSRVSAPVIFAAGVCLIGMCGGAELANMPTVCSDSFGVRYSSQNYSILGSGFALSSYVAPVIMSAFGSNYSPAMFTAGLLGLMGAVLILLLGRMNMRAAERA